MNFERKNMKRSTTITAFLVYLVLVFGVSAHVFNKMDGDHKKFDTFTTKVTEKIEGPPDLFSAKELVKTHPRMQQICDLAGGCDKVKTETTIYDGTGNTDMRNEIWFRVSTEIDDNYNSGSGWFDVKPDGTYFVRGVASVDKPVTGKKVAMNTAIEFAIDEWIYLYKQDKPKVEDTHVYPNSKSCDASCLQ